MHISQIFTMRELFDMSLLQTFDFEAETAFYTVVRWKKVLPQKFRVVPIVGVGPRLDL